MTYGSESDPVSFEPKAPVGRISANDCKVRNSVVHAKRSEGRFCPFFDRLGVFQHQFQSRQIIVRNSSDLNNRQAYDFVDKQVDFVELKLQDLVLWRQEPCNFEP